MVDDPPIHDTKAISFTGRSKQHEDRAPRGVALSTAAIALLASLGAADAQQTDGSEALACNDSIANTDVLLVKAFQQGEPLLLAAEGAPAATVVEGAPNAPVPVVGTDLCLVKLLVGPGNPGPEEAPSTSAGIGIEVLLPSPDRWNGHIRAYGNSGWSGTPQASLQAVHEWNTDVVLGCLSVGVL